MPKNAAGRLQCIVLAREPHDTKRAHGRKRHQATETDQEKGEASMKKQVLMTLAALSCLIALGAPPARAQFEIDPDHFEAPNTEPFDKVKTDTTSDVGTIHYDGEFRLANTVQCNGKSLRPGRYSVSIRYDGKVARATLNQDGQAIGIGGVVHRQAHRMGNDALIVELQGTTRRLSAIQVAKLDFVLDQEPPIKNSTHSEPRRLERLPLTETVRDPQASPKS
jgi:hypothetical protein